MQVRCHFCKELDYIDIFSTRFYFQLLCRRCKTSTLATGSHKRVDEVGLVTRDLQEAGDEWLVNFKRVKALKGLPRRALDLIAKKLEVTHWELSE